MEKFDIVVIGSGPGGYVAAIRASQLGFKVAVVERASLGGVCMNWGCIPTKALLKSAQAYQYAKRGGEFGFNAENVTVSLTDMVGRSREVAATMSKGVAFLFKKRNITLLQGTGKLIGESKVEVKGNDGDVSVVEADHIILATGSHPAELPFAPVDGKKIWCYLNALNPDHLPESIVVIGSGAIGSEFAYFYRSMGVDVTIIEFLDRILPVEDDDSSAHISRAFRKMGIKVMTNSAVKSIDTSRDGCILSVETKKGLETITAEVVLSAVGVRPNTSNLGLESLGIEMDRGKIIVDSHYRTSVKGVYAIGDIIPTQALAHVASAEAVNCVESIAGLNPVPVRYDNIPGCTFISPEVASTGATERSLKEKQVDYKVGKFMLAASGKAVASGERDGFVKLLIDAGTDEILGAHLVGANVSEMIGGIVTARNLGVKASDYISSVFPHPTISESIMEAAAASHGESVHCL